MALVTGTPLGTINSQEALYIDGAPTIYFQDYSASILNNPDGNGYYWGMSGTSTYPVKELDCITEASMIQGLTANDIQCDTVGVKGTITRRDFVSLQFSLQSFMPLSILADIMGFSTATVSAPEELVGIGAYDNTQFWHVYAPNVYNEDVGDYIFIWLHKAQFTDFGDWQFRYGQPWISQFTLKGYADTTYPSTQRFGMIRRADASAVT